MQRSSLPVNISLLQLTPQRLEALKPVKVLDYYDGGTTQLHEDGLFSISIFGRVGSEERDRRFSYVDIRTQIFHPYFFKQLVKLKALYQGIMSRKIYAVWDEKERDFVQSDAATGSTGFHFFLQHWEDIEFKRTGSDIRDLRIELIQKYKQKCLTDKILIMPAGLRDITVDELGRTKMDEINDIYRAIISISNAITTTAAGSSSVFDSSRYSLQLAFCRVYDYVNNLLEGKGGFFQKKWGARRIFNGTRNVISSMDTSQSMLGLPNAPKLNSTVVGLYQTMKGALPKSQYLVLNGWVSKVFASNDGNAVLVNPKTLHREHVKLSSETIDKWTTTAGIETVINSYFETSTRLKPVRVEGYYLGLIYRGPDNTFRIFNDIDDLPVGDPKFDKRYVFPLTLCELLYLSGYREWNTLPILVTRYPVTGAGSIYVSYVYLKNTVVSTVRRELNEDWQPMSKEYTALEYPVFENPEFIDTMIPHPSRLALMGADFDGDTASGNIVYTKESIDEAWRNTNKAANYINPRGGLLASPIVETVERVLFNFTGD